MSRSRHSRSRARIESFGIHNWIERLPERSGHAAAQVCPYRGLEVFREEDAPFFCGREAFVERRRAAVAKQPLVAVVGASGSGKSSLVRAGLIPSLRRSDGGALWEVAILVPGGRPLQALVRALLPLLEPELSELDNRNLGDRLQAAQFNLGPMVREELKRALTKPAEMVGLEFENGLVDRLLDDAGRGPGNLPLVQLTLYELWQRRRGSRLHLQAYESLGGVSGVLSKLADAAYDRLTADQQQTVRGLLLLLVRRGPDGEIVRRRVRAVSTSAPRRTPLVRRR